MCVMRKRCTSAGDTQKRHACSEEARWARRGNTGCQCCLALIWHHHGVEGTCLLGAVCDALALRCKLLTRRKRRASTLDGDTRSPALRDRCCCMLTHHV